MEQRLQKLGDIQGMHWSALCQRSPVLSSSEISSAKQESLQEKGYPSFENCRSCLMIRSLNKPAMRAELCTDHYKRNNGINSKWSSLSLGIQRTFLLSRQCQASWKINLLFVPSFVNDWYLHKPGPLACKFTIILWAGNVLSVTSRDLCQDPTRFLSDLPAGHNDSPITAPSSRWW